MPTPSEVSTLEQIKQHLFGGLLSPVNQKPIVSGSESSKSVLTSSSDSPVSFSNYQTFNSFQFPNDFLSFEFAPKAQIVDLIEKPQIRKRKPSLNISVPSKAECLELRPSQAVEKKVTIDDDRHYRGVRRHYCLC